jgi:anti-sigma B factor antagonist
MDPIAFKLDVQTGLIPGCTVLAVSGPLVLENLFKFQDAWRADQSDILLFDLSGVVYMDSSAIGSLVNAHVHRSRSGKKMALTGVTDRVKQILHVTKVDLLFQFFPDVPQAEKALKQRAMGA